MLIDLVLFFASMYPNPSNPSLSFVTIWSCLVCLFFMSLYWAYCSLRAKHALWLVGFLLLGGVTGLLGASATYSTALERSVEVQAEQTYELMSVGLTNGGEARATGGVFVSTSQTSQGTVFTYMRQETDEQGRVYGSLHQESADWVRVYEKASGAPQEIHHVEKFFVEDPRTGEKVFVGVEPGSYVELSVPKGSVVRDYTIDPHDAAK